jgi:hypothetical protein
VVGRPLLQRRELGREPSAPGDGLLQQRLLALHTGSGVDREHLDLSLTSFGVGGAGQIPRGLGPLEREPLGEARVAFVSRDAEACCSFEGIARSADGVPGPHLVRGVGFESREEREGARVIITTGRSPSRHEREESAGDRSAPPPSPREPPHDGHLAVVASRRQPEPAPSCSGMAETWINEASSVASAPAFHHAHTNAVTLQKQQKKRHLRAI